MFTMYTDGLKTLVYSCNGFFEGEISINFMCRVPFLNFAFEMFAYKSSLVNQ